LENKERLRKLCFFFELKNYRNGEFFNLRREEKVSFILKGSVKIWRLKEKIDEE
jgi:hypothetical protein